MEAVIQQKMITVRNLKRGFFVMLNDEKYIIDTLDLNNQTAGLCKIVAGDKITKSAPITVAIADITDKVLRYSGLVGENKRPFDLKYEDYARAIDGLKEDCYVVKEKKNAKEGDGVRITSIDVIDQHSLYKIEKRKGTIVEVHNERNKKVTYYVRLVDDESSEMGRTLPLEREAFALLDGDLHSLLHIKCDACEM